MGAPDVNEAEDVGRSMRRRLDELAETQHWVHHVGDLDSGEVLTTQLDRPVMPLSRAHSPQAIELAGSPSRWRSWASASRKELAAA